MIRIKTKEDIKILREGGKRHAEILKYISSLVKPGISAKFLDEQAYQMIISGGDKPAFLDYLPKGGRRPFPASLCVSINDEVVHGIPNEKEKILNDGDIVTIDLGLNHKGLITDSAITVAVGNVSKEIEDFLEITKKALYDGIKKAKGGNRIGDISSAIERNAISKGYGVVEELSGHGVGYDVHEDPFVPNYGDPGKGDILTPGMVIAIEPIFNMGSKHVFLDKDGWTYRTKDGSISAHFEHTILITKGEGEILTML